MGDTKENALRETIEAISSNKMGGTKEYALTDTPTQ